MATLQRRFITIGKAHQALGFDSPVAMAHAIVRETWRGIRRTKGIAQEMKVPILTADLRGMLGAMPDGPLGIRDQALLPLGFAGAFRRSKLVGLDVADLDFRE